MTRLRWIPAALAALAVAACGPGAAKDPVPSGSTPAAVTPSTAPPGGTVAGEPVGLSVDPCALLSPAEIKATLGVTVLSAKRGQVNHDSEDGDNQQCVYVTDAPPMGGPAADALKQLSGALGAGGGAGVTLPTGAIGVTYVQLTTAPDTGDTGPLPPGGKRLTGVGDLAVAIPSPGGQGGAAIAVKGLSGVWLMDLEGRKVTADQLGAALTAAVGHL